MADASRSRQLLSDEPDANEAAAELIQAGVSAEEKQVRQMLS